MQLSIQQKDHVQLTLLLCSLARLTGIRSCVCQSTQNIIYCYWSTSVSQTSINHKPLQPAEQQVAAWRLEPLTFLSSSYKYIFKVLQFCKHRLTLRFSSFITRLKFSKANLDICLQLMSQNKYLLTEITVVIQLFLHFKIMLQLFTESTRSLFRQHTLPKF